MRIAQVAPLWEQVPPPGYGGIELVVGHLTDELVRRGHTVTLFASGDSETLANLESVVPRSIRTDPDADDPAVYDALQLHRVKDMADQFDLIHFHTWVPPFQLTEAIHTPTTYTLHGRFSNASKALYGRYASHNFISISDSQRRGGPAELNYVRTVYNGIDPDQYEFRGSPENPPYLAFVGRMSPSKGPHLAIEVARRVGLPLKMAGKVDKVDEEFFANHIQPLIDGEQIQYLGEVDQDQKQSLFGGAVATLFPITWEEPFGLVMIEYMAAGTPVIGIRRGSVEEVIVPGKTGFICDSVDAMVDAVHRLELINRQHCRDWVVSQFSVKRMVDCYEAAYQKIMAEAVSRNGHRPVAAIV
jgi:glycosyltransferase involved in cell wall biosynthesis